MDTLEITSFKRQNGAYVKFSINNAYPVSYFVHNYLEKCTLISISVNLLGGVMFRVLASKVVGRGFYLRSCQTYADRYVFAVSFLSTHHYGVRATTSCC